MNINKILIAVDNSKYSDHAAEYGFDIARFYKAHVGLVNIVEPVIAPSPNTDMLVGSPFEPNLTNDPEFIHVQKEVSETIIERIINTYAGDLQVSQFTNYGTTSDGILNCSKEFNADMIVIGTHSRSGIDRLLMGSIAEEVVRHAEVPVLVVPMPESESPHKSA